MGDFNQAILDHEVMTLEQAQAIAAPIVSWLIEERIIEDGPCEACFGEGVCYRPGIHFMKACGGVENEYSNGNYAEFSTMNTNGMRIAMGRQLVFDGQGRFDDVPSPCCGKPVRIDDFWEAGDAWCQGFADTMRCPHCGQNSELPRWKHPDAGFVALAFEFWNWPPLSASFTTAIASRLGHHISVIEGKL